MNKKINKEELRQDIEKLTEIMEMDKSAMDYLLAKKKRTREESRLLTEFRGYAVVCQELIDHKSKQLKEMEK